MQDQAPATYVSASEDDAAVVLVGPVVSQPHAPRRPVLGLTGPEGGHGLVELRVEVTLTSPGQGFKIFHVAHIWLIGEVCASVSHSAPAKS